jgi:hypothetical protein
MLVLGIESIRCCIIKQNSFSFSFFLAVLGFELRA